MTKRLGGPCHRVILAVDIESSTSRTDSVKAALRRSMYELLELALVTCGVGAEYRDAFVDRGDGILLLIYPVDEVPKTLLLDGVIPTLGELLTERIHARPEHPLRLRTVLHAGEVHYDDRGCFGEALDIAFRLLDAPRVKRYFRTIATPLVLVVSDHIYRSVIRHGYAGIDEGSFGPVVNARVAGKQHHGWVHVPGVVAAKQPA